MIDSKEKLKYNLEEDKKRYLGDLLKLKKPRLFTD